jgi:transposase InsO family protein
MEKDSGVLASDIARISVKSASRWHHSNCGLSYLGCYNSRRPHSLLDGKTPDQGYFNQLVPEAVAA